MAVVFAYCRKGCKVRMVLDDVNGTVPVQYANQPTITMEPVKNAIPYLAWCLEHHECLRGKPLKVVRSAEIPCDDRCSHASGETCRCSCGGINHGSEAF